MALEWTPKGIATDVGQFSRIHPEQVLYELDSPMLFTFKNSDSLLLAYMCGEFVRNSRFIVVPTSQQIVNDLLSGEKSVRAAIDQPWCWCIDASSNGEILQVWSTSLHDLPANVLPNNNVFLDPSLEPIFAVKVEGRKLGRTNVPASVVKRAVDGAYIALKKLSESVGGLSVGRPSEISRRLYDFPTRHVALGSFEISFGEVISEQGSLLDDGSTRSQMEARGQELGEALKWATGVTTVSFHDIPLLEAMQKLAPPTQGLIETVSVSGTMLGNSQCPYVLDRTVSRKVRQALSIARQNLEQIITVQGEARELDKDKLSFRLKIITGEEYTCGFDEELYDDVMEAFASDQIIQIVLRQNSGTRQGQILAVSAASSPFEIIEAPASD